MDSSFLFQEKNMNKPYDSAVLVIQEYLQNSLEHISLMRGYSFAQISYSRWAAMELLKYLKEREALPPLVVIEEFQDKMDKWSCMSRKSGYVFSVACDMAQNIIDQLLH